MSEKIKVKFSDVGRSKKTWVKEFTVPLEHHQMVKEIKKQKALMSDGIDVEEDDEGGRGTIFVGVFRPVGTWEVVK